MMVLVTLWGVGHRFYETLMPQFAQVFALTGLRRPLTDSAYQIVYILGAIPAALTARAFGFKPTILIGLGCICIGAFTFYPAAETQGFDFFLFATMLLAYGWIMLEISVNPMVMELGSSRTAVRRLNLAQAAYPIGSLVGIFTARWLIDSDLALPKEAARYSIAHPYILLGVSVLVLSGAVEHARFPVARKSYRRPTSIGTEFSDLLRNPLYGFAMAAQFANILSMALAWKAADKSFALAFEELSHGELSEVFVFCLVLFGLGRLCATGLMWAMSPERVLEIFAACSVLAALTGAIFGPGAAAVASLAMCFFAGPAWPSILALAVNGLGERIKLAVAPIAMAGALGAVAARFLVDLSTPHVLLVAAAGAAIVFAYAVTIAKRNAGREAPEGDPSIEVVFPDNRRN